MINNDSRNETPRAVYGARLAERKARAAQLDRLHVAYGNFRVTVFLAGLAVAWLAFGAGRVSGVWLLVPLAIFLALAWRHDNVLQGKQKAERAVRFYEQGLARLDNVWMGRGASGAKFDDPAHPYARDLDIFGKGSLFERLCAARTAIGERTLADWLSAPAAPDMIRARQSAAAELRPLLDLREDLALRGEAAKAGVEPNSLKAWGTAPAETSGDSRIVALALAGFNLCAAGAWMAGHGFFPLLLTVALGQMVTRRQRHLAKAAMRDVEKPGRDLGLLALLLERIEAADFTAPLLQDLQEKLRSGDVPASARIARLQRLTELLELRGTAIFAFLDAILLFTFQVSLQIEAWRTENGPQLGQWLTVAGDFEALSSLAGYAYECPADPFPEICEGGENGPFLKAVGLAHPLLSETSAVRNSVDFGPERRLYVVSGSNMSGKSTFLRTIGMNVVLALAGAPVRAERFALSPLQIGASLQTNDSLQAGISRFYAELLCLRQVLALTEAAPPALFLLDEILHGTNSRDRLIGAEALLRSLVHQGAIGLVTTHDLALAAIAQDTSLFAVNVHFEDQIRDGAMAFDYRLRPGVVEKSNALELMRSVGLNV